MAQSVHPIFPASSWFAVATAAMWRGGTSAASAADVLRHYGRCYWELFKARLGCTAAQWRILEENQGQTQSQRSKEKTIKSQLVCSKKARICHNTTRNNVLLPTNFYFTLLEGRLKPIKA